MIPPGKENELDHPQEVVTAMETKEYRFDGDKTPGRKTGRIIVEGSSTNPIRYADKGGTVALSDDEATRLRKSYKLVAVGEAGEGGSDSTGDGGGDDSAPAETKAEQQAEQTGPNAGAQHPSADKDNGITGSKARKS